MSYYEGIGPEQGIIVQNEDAFDYALERCINGSEEDKREFKEEFKELLPEWFYSGNFIERGIKNE